MAALSINQICHYRHNPILDLKTRSCSRKLITISCQNRNLDDQSDSKTTKENKEQKGLLRSHFAGVMKFGKDLKDSCSPEQKGDWKDVTLMSISFAVYVYMSQKIVCAYCAWVSMAGPKW